MKNNEKTNQLNTKEVVTVTQDQDAKKTELKNILTEALLGKQNPKESIERLTTVLFPEEDLIDAVEAMKIKEELRNRFTAIQSKGEFTMEEIIRGEGTYTITLNFSDTKGFTIVHYNIAEIASLVSKKFKTNIQTNINISQTFLHRRPEQNTNFVLPGMSSNQEAKETGSSTRRA